MTETHETASEKTSAFRCPRNASPGLSALFVLGKVNEARARARPGARSRAAVHPWPSRYRECVGVYLNGAHFHGLAGIGVVGVDGFIAAGLVKGQTGAKVMVQHPFVDRDCEHWEWCLLCEKAAPVLDWKGGAWKCPSCGLGGAMDMWPWSKVRALNPSYPECPMWDVVYPLYGEPVADTVTDSEAPGAPRV